MRLCFCLFRYVWRLLIDEYSIIKASIYGASLSSVAGLVTVWFLQCIYTYSLILILTFTYNPAHMQTHIRTRTHTHGEGLYKCSFKSFEGNHFYVGHNFISWFGVGECVFIFLTQSHFAVFLFPFPRWFSSFVHEMCCFGLQSFFKNTSNEARNAWPPYFRQSEGHMGSWACLQRGEYSSFENVLAYSARDYGLSFWWRSLCVPGSFRGWPRRAVLNDDKKRIEKRCEVCTGVCSPRKCLSRSCVWEREKDWVERRRGDREEHKGKFSICG